MQVKEQPDHELVFSPVRKGEKPDPVSLKVFFAELPCYCPKPGEVNTRRTAPCDACVSRRYVNAYQEDD